MCNTNLPSEGNLTISVTEAQGGTNPKDQNGTDECREAEEKRKEHGTEVENHNWAAEAEEVKVRPARDLPGQRATTSFLSHLPSVPVSYYYGRRCGWLAWALGLDWSLVHWCLDVTSLSGGGEGRGGE